MSFPAARVGDMHICPMVTPGTPPVPHVGGPLLPPGVLTVLIGGMPAAVVGNMCTCVGPPDSVPIGSFSVYIGGRPALRVGDMTTHGGKISTGCMTVYIGDAGGMCLVRSPCAVINDLKKDPTTEEEKQKQVELQKELDISVKANLQSVPPEQRADVLNTAQHYQKTSDALDNAKLSKAVYGFDEKDPNQRIPPLGYKKIEGKELSDKFGLHDKDMVHDDSGFKSAIYESTTGKEPKYTAAFAGTEDGTDWKTNAKQGVGMETKQYNNAIYIGKKMRTALGPEGFDTTGHSLGGGLASAASATTGAKGTTFNAAGLHPNTTTRGEGEDKISDIERAKNESNVDSYQNSHCPLSAAQNNREGVLSVLSSLAGKAGGAVGSLVGPVGSVIGDALASTGIDILAEKGAMSKAYGNRIEVPPAITMAERVKRDGVAAAKSGHDMKEMIDLLDSQTKNDLEKLKKQFNCP